MYNIFRYKSKENKLNSQGNIKAATQWNSGKSNSNYVLIIITNMSNKEDKATII